MQDSVDKAQETKHTEQNEETADPLAPQEKEEIKKIGNFVFGNFVCFNILRQNKRQGHIWKSKTRYT